MPRKTNMHIYALIDGSEAIELADSDQPIFVTHDGIPHADDVAACAAWAVSKPEHKTIFVLRTRNDELIARLSHRPNVVICDVGGRFDPVANVFDHHFKDCDKREDGLPYSSFGLMVRHLGGPAAADTQMVRHIDAIDNGVKGFNAPDWWPRFNKSDPMGGSVAWAVHNAAPVHDDGSPVADWEFDAQFVRLVHAFEKIFMTTDEDLKKYGIPFPMQKLFEKGHAATERATVYSRRRVEAAVKEEEVMVLPQFEVSAFDVLAGLPEDHPVKYLVFPGPGGRQWMVQQVAKTPGSFEGRLPLPEAWAGKRGGELQEITGVKDAVFVHPGRFIGGAVSREGAVELAQLALKVEAERLAALRAEEEAKAKAAAEAAEEAKKAEAAQAEVAPAADLTMIEALSHAETQAQTMPELQKTEVDPFKEEWKEKKAEATP